MMGKRYACPCGNDQEFRVEGLMAYYQCFTQFPGGEREYFSQETYDVTYDQAVVCVPCGRVVDMLEEEIRIPWNVRVGEKYRV